MTKKIVITLVNENRHFLILPVTIGYVHTVETC